ncbi:MAG TPA: hypothetical protein VGQ32_02110 [Thermoanaerobaculia bacterium]|nr:hypothetical protein [Thermoanaerobaculia bacterium]
MRNVVRVLVFLAYVLAIAAGFLLFAEAPPAASADARGKVAGIAAKILKADYGDDRPALRKLYEELAPYTAEAGDPVFVSRVRYWRGFALWRRVLNGFNDKAPREEQEQDLNGCIAEFDDALAKDPSFTDARVGKVSCLVGLYLLDQKDAERRAQYITQFNQLREEAKTTASENPRVAWMVGGGTWYLPAEKGGGPAAAIEIYEKGLRAARKKSGAAKDSLDPGWGEPELLASLAWSKLNQPAPDIDAAEANARAAVALVPDWHYARDILMPQVRDAREAKAKGASPPPTPAAGSN